MPARDWRVYFTILLNVAAGAYGDAAIAGISIVTRIAMFINAFLIGFGQGFQPVCGFNYGAGLCVFVRIPFSCGGFIYWCALAGMGFAEEMFLFRKGDPDTSRLPPCVGSSLLSVGFMD